MDIKPLHCVHDNEHIETHDAICDTFAAIAQYASFHVGQEQLHAFPSTTFNSSHRQIDIVFTKYGIRTLPDIVIVDPTRANLFPQAYTTQGFAISNANQAKKSSYHN
jgi:hypothetical protein